jgi:thiamine-phosphate pyrophosphorylase
VSAPPLQLDLRLMLVTDPVLTRRRGLVETVLAAVAGGVTVVQLRDKTASDEELFATGVALKAALASTGIPLIVNDRPRVASAIGAQGVHLGQADDQPTAVRRLLGRDTIIGWSITALDQIAPLGGQPVDYIGLGPNFPTASKAAATPAMGLEAVRYFRRGSRHPIVAIGGVDAANAASVIAAGAAGVAVLSAICGAADPAAAARRLRTAIDQAFAAEDATR